MAKPTKPQIIAKLKKLGVEFDPSAKVADLKALLDTYDDGSDVPDDDDDLPDVDVDAADDDDLDDVDPVVDGQDEGDDDVDAGLTAADRDALRAAFKQTQQQNATLLPKQHEVTPKGGKTIWVLENLSAKYGGKKVILKAGQPLPKGVLSLAKIAELFEANKLSAKRPGASRGKKRSVLGL